MKRFFALLRVHQYIKNFFVFAPLFFSLYFSISRITHTFAAFLLFSLVASSIYIVNDLIDIEEDKKHPKKKFRPIASGLIAPSLALTISICLVSVSIVVALLFCKELAYILLFYFVLNIFYSFKLKKVVIIDIFTIATGFILRIMAGAAVIEVQVSVWLIIMTFLLALFLALAKRRDDVILSQEGKATRKNIDGYNLQFVDISMTLMAAVIIVSYILYTTSHEVTERLQGDNLYLTSIFVILGIMRYMQVTIVGEGAASPTKIVLTDMFLQATILLWLISFSVISLI